MRPNRRVDAAGMSALLRADHLRVQLLAHAMQPLIFERAGGIAKDLRHVRNRLGIVGRKLRVDHVSRVRQQTRAREIRHVRARLAREDRVSWQSPLLRTLDLAVPVRSFDQANGDAAIQRTRSRRQPLQHCVRTPLIRLHRETEARIVREQLTLEHRIDEQQRKLEALGFLRIDGEPDPGVACELHQRLQPWPELLQHTIALRELIARMKRGQFH